MGFKNGSKLDSPNQVKFHGYTCTSSYQLSQLITTEVPPYKWGIHSKTPSSCQKVCKVPNPICTMFFLIIIHTSDKVLGFLGDSDGKESSCNVGDLGSIPGSGRSPGGGNDNQLQYSCLKNPMDRVGHATVHGVTKSRT